MRSWIGYPVIVVMLLFCCSEIEAHCASVKDEPDSKEILAEVPTDEIMNRISKKYKNNTKKYASLAKKMDKHVRKTLEEADLDRHPLVVLVADLTESARSKTVLKDGLEEKNALLEKYPWQPQLELVLGLQDGSDRPIPRHENGFIDLGEISGPFPGYPELAINRYLYGYREIVGWKYLVKQGKDIVFLGRKKVSGKPTMESELPPWECIRSYLDGVQPEIQLFAIPWMSHLIHSRLVATRRLESGALSRMDEFMAFTDSRWNGFMFQSPYSKKPDALVQPVHSLFSEKGSFVYKFPRSSAMASQGDIPFVCLRTYQDFGVHFMGKKVTIVDFIRDTQEANEVRGRFRTESTYLKRYKALIDLIAKAILTPGLSYPRHLKNFDYQKGRRPNRSNGTPLQELDMPRKHAIVLWAYAGKNPEKLADILAGELMSREENAFPEDVSLPVQFTLHVRQNEMAMLDEIIERMQPDAAGAEECRMEFSPYLDRSRLEGSFHSDYLAASYHSYNEVVSDTIRMAALECVLDEIGAKWLTD